MKKVTRVRSIVACGAVSAALMGVGLFAGGCSAPGDTSGFKAEKKPSKADLTAQIAQVKANPKMPAGIKEMALKKLEKQLAEAH